MSKSRKHRRQSHSGDQQHGNGRKSSEHPLVHTHAEPAEAAHIVERRYWEQQPAGISLPSPSYDQLPPGTELSGMWAVLRARRSLVFGVAAVVFVAVALGTFIQQPVYRATGTLEFRKHAEDVMPLEAVFQLARISDQHLATQYSVLRSPALARRVVAELGLRTHDDFAGTPTLQAGLGSAGKVPESVISDFVRRLRVEPIEDSRMVRVSFEAGDPALAANVVNAVFNNYVALRVESAKNSIERLAVQVDSVRAALGKSEERLQQYVVANELMLVETGEGVTENMVQERLRHLQQQLTEAEAARYGVESRYNLVQRRNYDALASDVLRTLSLRVAELQGEYAKLRTTFTDEYPRTREVKRQLDALTTQLGRERTRIANEVRGEYLGAVRRQELLQQAFKDQKALADRLSSHTAEYRILKRDVEGHQQLYTVLQQKQKEAGVSLALAPAEVSVVDPAVPPEEPARPAPSRNLPLGAIVGLLLGVGVAFVRQYTDPALRTVEEVDSAADDVPILGLIPAMRQHVSALPPRFVSLPLSRRLWARLPEPRDVAPRTANSWVRIDQETTQGSVLAEAFSGLRTSVLLQNDGPLPKTLLVSSGQPGEGKTTISVNLAISIARLGRRVLLLDADIRRPSVHRAFSLPGGPGLAEYLSTGDDWHHMVHTQAAAGLDILTAGTPPDRPSELLSSTRMQRLLEAAESEYDVVVVDSPALLVNVPDARILAPLMEGVVLVVRSGVTPRALLQRMIKQTPNVKGVVVNDIDFDRLPSYYGRYEGIEDDRQSDVS